MIKLVRVVSVLVLVSVLALVIQVNKSTDQLINIMDESESPARVATLKQKSAYSHGTPYWTHGAAGKRVGMI